MQQIFDNESIKIGTFKANRSIDTLDLIKFWKTNYPINRLNERIRHKKTIKMYRDTPELIKFVREHANDYDTLNRKDVPRCINAE